MTNFRLSDATADDRRPKHQRILDHFLAEIRSGNFAPGAPLPTETQLAEEFGISRNTIRQAFNKLVEDGLVERIQGRGTFVTNDQQRTSRQQLNLLSLIAPQLHEGFYPALVRGFEQAAASIHHQVIVSNSENSVARQADLILQSIDQNVGGVAIVPSSAEPTPPHQIRMLQKNHIPVVFCHRSVDGATAPCVTWSGHDVGLLAGNVLLECGHQTLACLFPHRNVMTDEYEAGLRSSIESSKRAGRLVTEIYGSALPGAVASPAIRKSLDTLLRLSPRPTAIFCGNLPDAEQLYLQALDLGLDIPGDLSVLYFGGMLRSHGLASKLTCVAVDEQEVGAEAARLLEEIRSGRRPMDNASRRVLPVSLLNGETIGSPK